MVITPSIYTKELVHAYYGLEENKVQAIPLAIDTPSFQNESVQIHQVPYILYVGRISEMKNVTQVIKSFIIARRDLDIDLIIVGDDRNKLDRLLDEANCNAETKCRIKFFQNVSEADKFNLMKNASVFLYPTLFEGFGFPPLEAMSSGCPVIVSNNSSFPEVCGNAAYYVDPKNENEIAGGIIEILMSNTLKFQLIRRGLDRVKLFTWRETVAEHIRVMKSILYDSKGYSYTTSIIQKSFILKEEQS